MKLNYLKTNRKRVYYLKELRKLFIKNIEKDLKERIKEGKIQNGNKEIILH